MHRHLRRLERVWIDSPIYFVTTCTKDRRAVLASDDIANILIEEWSAARGRHGWVVGRYVIMPDHVHFFCRPEYEAETLPKFVGAWKSWTSRKINKLWWPRSATAATTLWQREFFDHVLRSGESHSEKWNYVLDNPVRAGLIALADDWKYAGEIETLMLQSQSLTAILFPATPPSDEGFSIRPSVASENPPDASQKLIARAGSVSHENEHFYCDSGDLLVNFGVERICGASVSLPDQTLSARSHHHNRGRQT